jgi:hypothetical protein
MKDNRRKSIDDGVVSSDEEIPFDHSGILSPFDHSGVLAGGTTMPARTQAGSGEGMQAGSN